MFPCFEARPELELIITRTRDAMVECLIVRDFSRSWSRIRLSGVVGHLASSNHKGNVATAEFFIPWRNRALKAYYRMVLTCKGVPNAGVVGARDIGEESANRPCHQNVGCERHGSQLIL